MRMWMCNPKILCNKHLLGEHVEHHMFIGSIKKNKNLQGFVDNNLMEIRSLYKRHNQLVEEMTRRGMNHKSKLENINLEIYPTEIMNYKIDKQASLEDLINRCPECKKRYNNIK